MKKFLLTSTISLLFPFLVFAQQSRDIPISNDGYAYASAFASDFSLLLSIVIGIIAAFLVFRAAKKLGGGLFGIVLNYVGVGMVFIVLGTLFLAAGPWLEGIWLSVTSTTCFALGYIFMVIGANKLLRGIMST